MMIEPIATLGPARAATPSTLLSCRVEHHMPFAHGYVEVRRYSLSRPVEEVMRVPDDVMVLNMALSTRPANIHITRIGAAGAAKVEHVGRLLVIMPGSRFHLSAPRGQLRSIHCAFSRLKFQSLLGEDFQWGQSEQVMELSGPGAELEGLLGRIYRELRQNLLGREAAVEAYADALCIEIARRLRHRQSSAQREARRGGLAPWRMRQLRERAYADAPAPRLSELAELCGMTERQLSRAFKTETGMTVAHFVAEATMRRAQDLLSTTELAIGAIAADLGFASATTFAQAFRRATGILPSEVRRQKGAQSRNSGQIPPAPA